MEITVVDAVSTWELNDALSHDDREVRRTNHGVVTQIDDGGQIWVRLAGADEDTPIAQTTVSVDAGDSVTVRIQDGRAYIDGSTSNPSASSSGLANVDGKAMQALTDAATAAQAALEAVADAATARQAATEAVESAETAQDAAEAAQGSADDAREAADKAIFSLTDLENVVGTVNWIAEHGEYVLTEDTAIVEGKPYYTRSGTSPDYIYTVVAEPVASELSTYYELHLDESVQNFLASHIWLDQYGLNIAVSNTNAYRIHQGTVDGTKTVGMYVIDAGGNIVADFTASGAQIGKTSDPHIQIDSDSFDIWDASNAHHLVEIGGTTKTYEGTAYHNSFINLNGTTKSISADDRYFEIISQATANESSTLVLRAIDKTGTSQSRIILSPAALGIAVADGTYWITADPTYTRWWFSAPHIVFESDNFTVNQAGNITAGNTLTLGTNTSAEENGIRIKGGGTRNAWLLRNISAANGDGDAVLLGNGGATVIGAGEAHNNLWNALGVSADSERLDLASDGNVNIWSNCNTIANRGQSYFTTNNSGSYAQTLCINNGLASPLAVASSANNGWTDTANNATYSSVQLRDKNGYWTGVWGSYVVGSTTAAVHGANCTYIGARNKTTSNTDVANYINLYVRKDGTRTVSVSDAGAWRTALGLGSLATQSSVAAGSEITGTLGKGNGGTGKTNTDTTYYGAKSLFSGTATTGTVTLSETAANYSMLLIQYRDNDSNYSSKLIIGPNGKRVVLDMVYGVSGVGNLKSRTVTISGTSITTVSGSTMDAAHNGGANTTNHIYITQVWGWK